MVQERLKSDWKKIAASPWMATLSKQFNYYEGKVKSLVHEFDLKSQVARIKGKKQINKFSAQLKKTRKEVEKKVTKLLNEEGHLINDKVSELVDYLKSMAQEELKGTKIAKRTASKVKGKVKARAKKATSGIKKVAKAAVQDSEQTQSSFDSLKPNDPGPQLN